MFWGAEILPFVDFPCSEVLGPDATPREIRELISRHGEIFIKPIFKGGVGKKGKAGLLGRATTVEHALEEKERLYFVSHQQGYEKIHSEGVSYEGSVPAEHEVYFCITDYTRFRAPTMILTHRGGVDIEDLDPSEFREVRFDPLVGLKGYMISRALHDLNAPPEIISPLVQYLPKLWDLYHNYGMTLLELNPIRMKVLPGGKLQPVACDFKCSFDIDDSNWQRLPIPKRAFAAGYSEFEQEINKQRTYQGQSDVYVVNRQGTITAMTFGGGANALVTELLGQSATISSDFGGNPPYEKMKKVAEICFNYWLPQSNVLFIIGGRANNTDIYKTFRAMADALRAYYSQHPGRPLFVVVGRGGPNVIQGMVYLRDTLDNLEIPYRMFGDTSAMGETVNYALAIDNWMRECADNQVPMSLEA